ncbi:hypothetical protein SEA_STICKYNOTE_84 [Corynebacterium phage Stickynote]|uniref:Uncharacterized protein n=4 Tax=Ceetrepovirus TaxID=2560111 RepID=A0A2H4P8Q5_9CAUD|nr:hypothetical protein FDJ10_gp60 [Corynebacterium phage C3PO]YP_009620332.1 hypothetical protein FDJ11_gp62 [Corynebacterium phage Darwin]YP_010103280.1 hypothetical protein KNU65_gp58 [Corynebacterium phage Stickynote]AYQ98379.1 hypothetical protein CRUELLA_83 [Corynebacterium phage Cruella]ATW58482.1 hypothetical protein SEA_C3PO_83 [Corynebacterium phage C3PO]ATW58607.1 hypothetical protein SEA_DARWIN_86 [Corynebacterium phage Darwin]QDF19277.1 hypothetical protein SEA_STICKYNOTE_84 [Cor
MSNYDLIYRVDVKDNDKWRPYVDEHFNPSFNAADETFMNAAKEFDEVRMLVRPVMPPFVLRHATKEPDTTKEKK